MTQRSAELEARAPQSTVMKFGTRPFRRGLATLSPSTLSLAQGILAQRRDALARSITLIESTREDHKEQAGFLLDWLGQHRAAVPSSPPTLRIGVAGPPGAGKSTFIETLGMRYISKANRVCVIPVDPSSHISGGSILGDKTRMEQLSRSDNAYVRASPTRGVLGGIAEHTSEVIYLCESAGFNLVFVESVGLGQSEVDIDIAVDMLLVLVPPGGGDGLQASKKGIMEAADLVVINKADGHLLVPAKHTKADYSAAMSFIRRKHPSWQPMVVMVSSVSGQGLKDVEAHIEQFRATMTASGALQQKRAHQSIDWMRRQFRRRLVSMVEGREATRRLYGDLEEALATGKTTPRAAASKLLSTLKVH